MRSIEIFVIFIVILVTVATGIQYNIQSKIINGSETTIEKYPYLVSVRYYDSHISGGIIINENTILTTHQYVTKLNLKKLTIRIGATKHAEGQEVSVASFQLYPNYNIIYKEPDLAIIKLASTIRFSDKIKPIHIRDKNQVDLPEGTIVEVIGWGSETDSDSSVAETLRKVNEEIISYVDCNMKYGISMITYDKMICATNTGQGFCKGDLGGPMMFNNDLIGLASWNYECGNPEIPDVFVYIKPYYDWIQTNAKKL